MGLTSTRHRCAWTPASRRGDKSNNSIDADVGFTRKLRFLVELRPDERAEFLRVRARSQFHAAFDETQQIIIENRPGASSLVGTQYVAKADIPEIVCASARTTMSTLPPGASGTTIRSALAG